MKLRIPKTQAYFFLGDVILVMASLYLAPVIRFGVLLDPMMVFGASEAMAVFLYLLALYIFNFYNLRETANSIYYALRLAFVVLAVNLVASSLFYIFHLRLYASGIIAITAVVSFILLLGWRIAVLGYFHVRTQPARILVLGAGQAGMTLHELLAGRGEYVIVGYVDDDEAKSGTFIGGVPVIESSGCLGSLVKNLRIDQVVVAMTHSIRADVFRGLVQAKFLGVDVFEMPTFYERVAGKIPVLHTSEMWLGYADISGVKRNIYNYRLKKVFDKLFSLVGLLLAAPIMLVTAILIKLGSPGTVLYKQKRVGWDEREFELYKFRSMHMNAEENGAVWAQVNDSRVTWVGNVIRRLRIDEIPQLWNVLMGDMSFVGPRPERPEFVRDLMREIPYYSLRHAVRPGITGWAQINYPYGASRKDAMEKLQYDLYYIKNMSMILDLYILLRTARVVLSGTGAR
ncbi:MAG: sugar transferase [Deltaproteobacteria bacterium HGW-Deltaproteobacteria-19]|nr:MAG: sugar transferase [Deltaproteobacteria bacterium HGW-Deltaproteobacteria-19]